MAAGPGLLQLASRLLSAAGRPTCIMLKSAQFCQLASCQAYGRGALTPAASPMQQLVPRQHAAHQILGLSSLAQRQRQAAARAGHPEEEARHASALGSSAGSSSSSSSLSSSTGTLPAAGAPTKGEFVQDVHAAAAQAAGRKQAADAAQPTVHRHGHHQHSPRLKGPAALQKLQKFRRPPTTTMQEYPQLQQQSQQQLQDSPQQLPLYQAPPQPQQQQQQRSVSDSLKVAFTGVLHALLEPGDSGWKIMKFKQVSRPSNARPTKQGWVPADEDQALRDLQPASSFRSYSSSKISQDSRSSSRSTSSRDEMSFAAKIAATWLCVVGTPGPVKTGKAYSITGEWSKHRDYNWQIKCWTCKESLEDTDPATYLASLEGLGPGTAARLVDALGSDMHSVKEVLDLPEQAAVARLKQIPKIGPQTARKIKVAWDKAQGSADALGELQQVLKLNPLQASKVLTHYGEGRTAADVVQLLQQNPYALLGLVAGLSLQQADLTAESLGFDPRRPERGAAYLFDAVWRSFRQGGQAGIPWHEAERITQLKLQQPGVWPGWPPGQSLRAAAELLVSEGKLVVEEQRPLQQEQIPSGYQGGQQLFEFKVVNSSWSADAVVYLKAAHEAEVDTVDFLLLMLQRCVGTLAGLQHQQQQQHSQAAFTASDTLLLPLEVSAADVRAIEDLEQQLSLQLDKPVVFNGGQRIALVLPLLLPLMILTGGPGCGKTLVSQGLSTWHLDNKLDSDLFMAAPTGRAAQRMQETLSEQHAEAASSSTIHRMLGYRNQTVAKRLQKAAAATAAEAAEAASVSRWLTPMPADAAGDDAGPETDLGSLCEHNREHPLRRGRYLIDEVSMADMALTAALFNALRGPHADHAIQLTLIGDPDQLPPVSPGQPIADAVAEGVLPCVDLREIYRTAKDSAIVASAHAINKERFPMFSAVWDINTAALALGMDEVSRNMDAAAAKGSSVALDGSVIMLRLPDSCSAANVAETLRQAAQQLVPRLDCDPQRGVQVLSPIRRLDSPIGVNQLNQTLQGLFNPPAADKKVLALTNRYGNVRSQWREGDRVTHLKNNTQLDVYNGDQGYIDYINVQAQSVRVRYPPRAKRSGSGSSSDLYSSSEGDSDSDSEGDSNAADRTFAADVGEHHLVTYQGDDINDMLQLAWATTVHKAQGGEFPVVLLALHQSCGQALKRQLLYTAVSRAQKLLVVVGTDAAINTCLHNTGKLDAGSNRFRARLRSGRVQRGLPTIQRAVWADGSWV